MKIVKRSKNIIRKISVILVAMIISISSFVIVKTSYAQLTHNDTFYSTASDGCCWIMGPDYWSYNYVWSFPIGTVAADLNEIAVGQRSLPTTPPKQMYEINRGFVFFDTSSLPDNAIITSATLMLRGSHSDASDSYNIVIQNGQPIHPHDPLIMSDYHYGNYSGNGGSIGSDLWVNTGYNNINLNANGISWINKQGTTKFCLRTDQDINGIPPEFYHWNIIAFYSSENNNDFRPKLTIEYNTPPNTPNTPSPTNHATGISINADLSWTGGDPDSGDTVTYDVYFGTSSNPPKVISNQSGTSYDPGTMNYGTQYYWKIVAWDNHGASTTGPIWDFTTEQQNHPPNTPSNPSPANHATSVSITADLSWTGGDPDSGDTVTYDVYFGTSSTPPLMSYHQTITTYDTGTMSYNTQYYWNIVAWDNHGLSATGPLWDFTTATDNRPDLNVSSITIPNFPFNTRKINIGANIRNIGGSASPSFSCGLYVDGGTTPLATSSVDGIQPGSNRDTSFTDIQLSAGGHTIRVVADYNHLVNEGNENNNELTTSKTWIYGFSLNVSIGWNANHDYIRGLQNGLKNCSNYLFDVTDGYMCFDKIKINTNGSHCVVYDSNNNPIGYNIDNDPAIEIDWDRNDVDPIGAGSPAADVLIFNNSNIRPFSDIGGINDPIGYIFLGNMFYYQEITQDGTVWKYAGWNNIIGFRTIAHEFGHYGLWLHDEYDENTGDALCHGGSSLGDYNHWCMMADQWTSSELCNPTNHNISLFPDSCWETLNNHYPFATIPNTVLWGPNDNVGQFINFFGASPSPGEPYGNTNISLVLAYPGDPNQNSSITIDINATDPDGIYQIILFYSVNNTPFTQLLMHQVIGQKYSVTIPHQYPRGSHVTFYFKIQDNIGNMIIYPSDGYITYTVSNNPPKKPLNISPQNGSTDVSINPVLSTYVSDPDTDPLTVCFYDEKTITSTTTTESDWNQGTFSGTATDGQGTLRLATQNPPFGTGADGNVIIASSTPLNRDMNYRNLTVNSGVILDTKGYTIRVSGTLKNYGTITDTYSGGSGGSAGNGGRGQDPWQNSNPVGPVDPESGNPGGSGGAGTVPQAGSGGSGGGGGGGGGGAWWNLGHADADGGNGGNGGTGGKGGGYVKLYASVFENHGLVQADGLSGSPGAGGTNGEYYPWGIPVKDLAGGGGGGGAGGNGGNGGTVEIVYSTLVIQGTIHANGGSSGTGGTHGNGHSLSYGVASGGHQNGAQGAGNAGAGGNGEHRQGYSSGNGGNGGSGSVGSQGSATLTWYQSQYVTTGSYHKIFDAGSNAQWSNSNIIAYTPSGTSLSVRFGVNLTGSWVWYSDVSSVPLSRWLQVNITLHTTNPSVTPTVDQFTLTYSYDDLLQRWINISSGSTVNYHWYGLLPNTMYQWKVVLDDGKGGHTEASYQFTTGTQGTICGDCNFDGVITVTDAVYLINYKFLTPAGPPPMPMVCVGDANGDGVINVTDIVFLVNYLFLVPPGPTPGGCCQ